MTGFEHKFRDARRRRGKHLVASIHRECLMPIFRYAGIPTAIVAEVRVTMRAPGRHVAQREVARGYGPCRSCLDTFKVGEEERILFTHQPINDAAGLPAPGPVFIHAEACVRYDGLTFPPGLRGLPIAVEGLARGGWIVSQEGVAGPDVETVIARAFENPNVSYVHLRNAEAGCFMARVEQVFACELVVPRP